MARPSTRLWISLAARYEGQPIDAVVGIESRGFMFSAPLAYRLGVGLVPVRKHGKLPAATYRVEYDLEYGSNKLEIHRDAFQPGARVVIVDDLLATGGTVAAACQLVEMAGGVVAGDCVSDRAGLSERPREAGELPDLLDGSVLAGIQRTVHKERDCP